MLVQDGNIDISFIISQKTRERDYWLNKLSGDLVRSSFAYDYKKKDSPGYCLEKLEFKLTKELFSKLMILGKGSDVKLNMILAAGLAVLLGKYSGNRSIVVGAPILKQEIHAKFVNTVLALRSELSPGLTFKELLLQTRETIMAAAENQNYPVKALLNHLNMPFSEDYFPLFDVVILLENIHDRTYIPQDIRPNMIFSFLRTEGSLAGKLEYNSSLYSQTRVEQIITHFSNVMRGALLDVDTKISDIDMLSPEERRQILVDFNNEDGEYGTPAGKTAHRLFEEQAEKKPGRIVCVYEDRQLTYKELNEKADRMAKVLAGKGVTPDTIVGLMVERSVEMMVGIFAILKAGGAYLPIEWEYPDSRNLFLVKDSRIDIVLTQEFLMGEKEAVFKDFSPGCIVPIDDESVYTARTAEAFNPGADIKPGNMAYVIYTSGTTGKQKGVVLEHRNLTNLVYGLKRKIYMNYKKNLKIVLVSPFVFDASVKQIFAAPLLGHCLHIASKSTRIDGTALIEFYKRHQIDISDGTPTHLKILRETMTMDMGGLEVGCFLIGGEPLDRDTLEDFLTPFEKYMGRGKREEKLPGIVNVYGPTECCVDTTVYRTVRENPDVNQIIPIGKPLPNVQLYILGLGNELQPVGVGGEIYISGIGVARGYLNSPLLTAEKFVENPFSPGTRMYKSGDFGRWMPDGNIEFLGRADNQVKIRGYRIELEEIENHMLKYPGIKEAVVLVKGESMEDKYLCGYFAGAEPNSLDTTQIREYLLKELPEFIVPSRFIQLEKMPLTSNGKVDRRGLPEPAADGPGNSYAAPRGALEKELIRLWSEVLNAEPGNIGIDDNFFEIGGHSLRATILISKIYKAFDIMISLQDMFKNPTIRGTAAYIKNNTKDSCSAIPQAAKKEYYPLSSAQKRLYAVHQLDPGAASYNLASPVILEGALSVDRLESVFQELINRHESLRTSFEVIEGEPRQRIPGNVPFAVKKYRMKEDEAVEFVREGFIRPFILSKAPLLRVGVINISENRNVMIIHLHHIIADGTSVGILQEEIMELYEGKTLPPLRLQYKDYCLWQNSEEQKEIEKKQEQFWLKKFAGEIPKLNLPLDFSRPSLRSFEGSSKRFGMGVEKSRKIKELSRQEGITLYMFLLALFNTFLFKITGQEDILVGTPIANRRHADLQPIVGMFANVVVMRNFPGRNKTFRTLLQEIKINTLESFDNQDYKLENLIDRVIKKVDVSRYSLYEVSLLLQNMEHPDIENKDLRMISIESSLKVSRSDLLFLGNDRGEEIDIMVEYCPRLFKEKTIQMFIDTFNQVTASVLEDMDIHLKDIEISAPDVIAAKTGIHQLDQLELGF